MDNPMTNQDRINKLFNELHLALTSTIVRTELGDMSGIASKVDAAHHDFGEHVMSNLYRDLTRDS